MQVAISNGTVLVPPLTIALSQRECMCQSMEALVASVDSPVPTSCERTSNCNGVNCNLTVPIAGMVYLETDFEVCWEPPRVQVVVVDSSGTALLNQYFNTSDTVDINVAIITFTLDVIIENYDYSMIIQVEYCIVNLLDV